LVPSADASTAADPLALVSFPFKLERCETPLTTFRLYSDMLESGAVKEEKRGGYLRLPAALLRPAAPRVFSRA
jgi:hypothetical protein